MQFQSTLSVWRATLAQVITNNVGHIFQSTLSVWRAAIGQAVKIFRYSSSLNISGLKYLRLKSFEFIKGYVIIFKAVRFIYAFPECDFEQSVYLSG